MSEHPGVQAIPTFDSHAHLDMPRDEHLGMDGILGRAWDAGVVGIVAIAGANRVGDYATTLDLSRQDPRIFVAAGIHPHLASQGTNEAMDDLRGTLSHERVVALGEIGLDYHYNRSAPEIQRQVFVSQIRIARQVGLPIVVHTREADEDTIAILRDEGADQVGGVIHCFSSGECMAQEALKMGFYLSFSGIVTFPKAGPVAEVATGMPRDRILAETDSPFLSPVPFRGRVNEPARVVHVVEKLASLRGEEVHSFARTVVENSRACFSIAGSRQ